VLDLEVVHVENEEEDVGRDGGTVVLGFESFEKHLNELLQCKGA
jgi:hypothetical protein